MLIIKEIRAHRFQSDKNVIAEDYHNRVDASGTPFIQNAWVGHMCISCLNCEESKTEENIHEKRIMLFIVVRINGGNLHANKSSLTIIDRNKQIL